MEEGERRGEEKRRERNGEAAIAVELGGSGVLGGGGAALGYRLGGALLRRRPLRLLRLGCDLHHRLSPWRPSAGQSLLLLYNDFLDLAIRANREIALLLSSDRFDSALNLVEVDGR